MKTDKRPKPADPFEDEIRKRMQRLQELNNRAPKPSLKMIAVQLKALSMEAGRLVRHG